MAANLALRTHAPRARARSTRAARSARSRRSCRSRSATASSRRRRRPSSRSRRSSATGSRRGRIDVGFLGAAQIDRFGNLNSTVIGDYDEPKVRLPGAGGAPEIATSAREVFVMLRQTPRTFVQELDFRTTLGRAVSVVVTDLGVLEPRGEERELTLTQSIRASTRTPRARRPAGPARRRRSARDSPPDGRGAGRAARARHGSPVTDVDPAYLFPEYRSTVTRAPSRVLLTLPEELHDLRARCSARTRSRRPTPT